MLQTPKKSEPQKVKISENPENPKPNRTETEKSEGDSAKNENSGADPTPIAQANLAPETQNKTKTETTQVNFQLGIQERSSIRPETRAPIMTDFPKILIKKLNLEYRGGLRFIGSNLLDFFLRGSSYIPDTLVRRIAKNFF